MESDYSEEVAILLRTAKIIKGAVLSKECLQKQDLDGLLIRLKDFQRSLSRLRNHIPCKEAERLESFIESHIDDICLKKMMYLPEQYQKIPPAQFQMAAPVKEMAPVQARGPYRSYTLDQKMEVQKLHKEGLSFTQISKELSIPQKNIMRWCRQSFEKKREMKSQRQAWLTAFKSISEQSDLPRRSLRRNV